MILYDYEREFRNATLYSAQNGFMVPASIASAGVGCDICLHSRVKGRSVIDASLDYAEWYG